MPFNKEDIKPIAFIFTAGAGVGYVVGKLLEAGVKSKSSSSTGGLVSANLLNNVTFGLISFISKKADASEKSVGGGLVAAVLVIVGGLLWQYRGNLIGSPDSKSDEVKIKTRDTLTFNGSTVYASAVGKDTHASSRAGSHNDEKNFSADNFNQK